MTPSTQATTRLPDGARRNGGRAGLLAVQARTDVTAAARNTSFLVGTIAIPVILYAMFGLSNGDTTLPAGTRVTTFLMASFAAYGVVSLAIFTFGEWIAQERTSGWTRTVAATPLPVWVVLGGKVVMAVVAAVGVVAALALMGATLGGVRLDPGSWAGYVVVSVGGVVAFSTLGFAIAYLVPPKAAVTLANLVFLPLSFCSGFFFPLDDLPQVLQDAAPYLPTYHFGQLVWRQVAAPEDAELLIGVPFAGTATHLAWVVASFVLFGLLAVWAARRESVTRRG